jgi:hypothetical protein
MRTVMILSLILNVLLMASYDKPCARVETEFDLGTKGNIERGRK